MRRSWWPVVSAAFLVSAAALVFAPASPSAAAGETAKDGKTVFLEQKCNLCHAIQSQGVEHKLKTSKAPDLSSVGLDRDAAWIKRWLHKEEELHGKKHAKNYQGTDEDTEAIAGWLVTLRQPKS